MRSIANPTPAVYAFGATAPHAAGRVPPAYTPIPDDDVPSPGPFEAWTADELDEWVRAELKDRARPYDGGW